MPETQVQSLGQEDPLEEEMATHFSVFVWEIPRTETPDRLKSMGSQTAGHGLEAEWQQPMYISSIFSLSIHLLKDSCFFLFFSPVLAIVDSTEMKAEVQIPL